MKRLLYISLGIMIAVLFFSTIGLTNSKNKVAEKPKTSPTSTPAASKATPGETHSVQIVASEYSYSPSTISINKGDTLVVTLRNIGKMPHNIVFEGFKLASQTIQSGQSDTIELTATESGKSKFYCSVGNHRALGMEGDLEVK